MPESLFCTASDVDEFRAAMRPASREYLVTGRGRFAATAVKVDFDRLWLQRLDESLPRAFCVATTRVSLCFAAASGPFGTLRGRELGAHDVGVCGPGEVVWHTTPGISEFAAVSLPAQELTELAGITGRDMAALSSQVSLTPGGGDLARLRGVHAAVTRLAQIDPGMLANPATAHSLEASLIEAFVACLGGWRTRDSAALRQHAYVVRQLHELVEEHPGEPLYLPEICRSLGVSIRTLHYSCQEQLGMSPKRFLALRRLHLAHRSLLRASPAETSVTEVATRLGFWELGRFAAAYRAQFGAMPSSTLRRMADAVPAHAEFALSA